MGGRTKDLASVSIITECAMVSRTAIQLSCPLAQTSGRLSERSANPGAVVTCTMVDDALYSAINLKYRSRLIFVLDHGNIDQGMQQYNLNKKEAKELEDIWAQNPLDFQVGRSSYT
jgi:hypothetical protein